MMNERILQELEKQADKFVLSIPAALYSNEYTSVFNAKFAELIVRECANTIQDFVDHRFPASEYPDRLKKYFGVEESKGWVCPKCGTDRTKAVCPKGHTAALTGDCPMVGVAL